MAYYFASDMHLGAGYIADPRAHERMLVDWLETIAADAEGIFLLGDVLDYWYEYRRVVPRGYARFFGALARLADNGTRVVWLKGNHDIWTFGYLSDELGVEVVDDHLVETLDGKRIYMAHGDNTGYEPRSYRIMRSIFRSPLCQRLYSSLNPSWTIPLAHGWSSSSRRSHARKEVPCGSIFQAEDDSLVRFSREYLATHGQVDYFIFGHKHILVDYPLTESSRLIVLGDWIKRMSYARLSDGDLTLHTFSF